MGHISEAFDIGFDQLHAQSINPYYNYEIMRTSFYDNLYFDSIKATKGGDNAIDVQNQLSVKAFNASLYSIATIYGDLVQLTDMLDNILNNGGNKERAEKQLNNMFIEKSKYNTAIKNIGKKSAEEKCHEAFSALNNAIK